MSAFTTYTAAVDTMYDMLNTAWQNGSVITPVPEIRWPETFDGVAPDPTKYWARAWIKSNSDKQVSIGRPTIYTTVGYLYVECFAPISEKKAGAQLRALAQLVKDVYTSKTVNGVRFPSVLIREMASEAKWHSHRVAAEFSFDYLK